jgi:hypothetical protein
MASGKQGKLTVTSQDWLDVSLACMIYCAMVQPIQEGVSNCLGRGNGHRDTKSIDQMSRMHRKDKKKEVARDAWLLTAE